MNKLLYCVLVYTIFIPQILTQNDYDYGGTDYNNNIDTEEEQDIMTIPSKLADFSKDVIVWDQTWPDGIVYYEISPEFNESSRQLIFEAMKNISSKTCIRYKEHTNEPDYIYFRKKLGDGCHTHAGKKGGKQILNLDPRRCIQHGKIMHELLHVVGFHHEHQRPDRDEYIKVYWDNIKPDDWVQLEVFGAKDFYLKQFPYDLDSVLHYGNESFFLAVDRTKPILESKRYAPNLGQRSFLSDFDVDKVNFLYNCDKKSKIK